MASATGPAVDLREPGGWRRAIDTGLDSPHDIASPGEEPPLATLRYQVLPRSIVVLLGESGHT